MMTVLLFSTHMGPIVDQLGIIGAIIAAVAAVTAAVITAVDAANSRSDLEDMEGRARADRARAEEEWAGLGEHVVDPEDLGYESAEGYLLDDPELAKIYADEGSVAAQREALQRLSEWSTGDLTEIDLARQQQSRMEQGQFSRGAREAALANMEARGLGGSNVELAAILSGQQAATQRMAADDLQTRAAAQQRALSATEGMGSLGSQMRSQSFSEEATRANAVDAWNQDNMDYRRRLQERNTNRRNDQMNTEFNQRQAVAAGRSNAITGNATQNMQDAQQRANYEAEQTAGNAEAIVGAGQAIGGIADAATADDDEDEGIYG